MKYQIGDDILVLHTNEEGKVIDIINDEMVMIEVRSVKFPAYTNQIDFPYFYRFTKNNSSYKPNDVILKNSSLTTINLASKSNIKCDAGVWIALTPKFGFDEFDDEYVKHLNIHLVNNSFYDFKFHFKLELNGTITNEVESKIKVEQEFLLFEMPFENLNDSPTLLFEFTLVEPNKNKEDYFESILKLKPKQIFQKIETLKKTSNEHILFNLFNDFPNKVYKESFDLSKLSNIGYKVYDASKIKENLQQPRSVLDLHIEKIIDDWQTKTNLEILAIQLAELEKWFDIALANKLKNFTVIHGIGKGKLKEEVHQFLKTKPEVKNFINQYHERFGYGATEVIFN